MPEEKPWCHRKWTRCTGSSGESSETVARCSPGEKSTTKAPAFPLPVHRSPDRDNGYLVASTSPPKSTTRSGCDSTGRSRIELDRRGARVAGAWPCITPGTSSAAAGVAATLLRRSLRVRSCVPFATRFTAFHRGHLWSTCLPDGHHSGIGKAKGGSNYGAAKSTDSLAVLIIARSQLLSFVSISVMPGDCAEHSS